jgi:tetratricopeptide (TPR) repeat protein
MGRMKYVWITLAVLVPAMLVYLWMKGETKINVRVHVIQESGESIEGARVRLRNQTGMTNESGDAAFIDVPVSLGDNLAILGDWNGQSEGTFLVVTSEAVETGLAEVRLVLPKRLALSPTASSRESSLPGGLRVRESVETGPVTIVINDSQTAESPLFLELAPGTYRVRIQKPGFITRDTLIEVESEKLVEFYAALIRGEMPKEKPPKEKPLITAKTPLVVDEPAKPEEAVPAPRMGLVEIADLSEGARIYVDNAPVAVSLPNTILELNEGDHTIVVAQGSVVDTFRVQATAEAPVWKSVEYHQCYDMAKTAFASKDYERTVGVLGKCNVSRFSADKRKDALYWQGVSYFMIRHYKEAEDVLQRLTDLSHDHTLGYFYLGQSLQHLSRYEDALAAFDEVKRYEHRLGGNDRRIVGNRVRFYASLCYYQIYRNTGTTSDKERAIRELTYYLKEHCSEAQPGGSECSTASRYLEELEVE